MTGEFNDIVVLTSVATEAEAAIILAALEDGGLRAAAPGEVQVLVCRADLAAAEQILSEHRSCEPD